MPFVSAERWVTAPERRTHKTSVALCGGATVSVDPDLRDCDCGDWAGRTLAEIHDAAPDALVAWLSNPKAAPHGGESLADLLGRVDRWLGGEAARGGRTAAVTHPLVLRAAIVSALGSGPSAFWRIDVQPLTRVRLSHDGRRWVLQGLIPPPLAWLDRGPGMSGRERKSAAAPPTVRR